MCPPSTDTFSGEKFGVSMEKLLTLYTGDHCHLCDQAKQLLRPLVEDKGWALIEQNIKNSQDLTQTYAVRIPVVLFPDGIEKGWPFTAAQIERMMKKHH
jgi:hypothetical protein